MNYTQQQHGQKNRIKTSFCTVNYEIMLFVMIYNHFCFVIFFSYYFLDSICYVVSLKKK